MTHDPLCKGGDCPGEDCDCLFIAEIRADEQARQREEMTALLLAARNHP